MKVLIACEESQRVCCEFRKLGHEAFSCDILECSGEHPEWHIQGNCIPILNGNCNFITQDKIKHTITTQWDLIIAHPPCTDIASSGARHFKQKIIDGRQQRAIEFFMKCINANCEKIAVENPIGVMSTKYRQPDQIIQPYMFGEPYKKTTCLWLKNLKKLEPTNIVEVCDFKEYKCKNGKVAKFSNWYNEGGKDRQRNRSKTFIGIAKAMAQQWGGKNND